MSEVSLSKSDLGKTFHVLKGDSISIRLEENPTTGYRWVVEAVENQVLELQESSYSASPGAGIGAGGMRTFNFWARFQGTANLQLNLRREWESSNAEIDHFEVIIQVQ